MGRTGYEDLSQSVWRIEKPYSSGVLIGNWSEERYKFTKSNYNHNSTYRHDFKRRPSNEPDAIIRRKGELRNEGLGKIILHHDGNKGANNLITWYDEDYNGRKREPWDQLPPLRHWDSNTMSWAPEKSDYPMKGASTNFGLYEKVMQRRAKNEALFFGSRYSTTYSNSYIPFPRSAFSISRFATHKDYLHEVKPEAITASPAANPVASQHTEDQALTTVAC